MAPAQPMVSTSSPPLRSSSSSATSSSLASHVIALFTPRTAECLGESLGFGRGAKNNTNATLGDGILPGGKKGGASAAGFDPEALERGAAALKEINKSPVARQVVELSKAQEVTKQAEYKADMEKARAEAARAEAARESVRWEEQRKTNEHQAQLHAQLRQQDDEAKRRRSQEENEAARARNAELVKMQEESLARQEGMRAATEEKIQLQRRETELYKSQLEQDQIRARALAEAEGRIKEAKSLESINRQNIGVRIEAEGKKLLQAINVAFDRLGEGFYGLVNDRQALTTTIGGLAALALGVYGAREGVRVAGKQVEKILGQPPLIRESSRRTVWLPFSLGGASPATRSGPGALPPFASIKLPPVLHDQLTGLASFTSNARSYNSPFRHMLFYGTPGTGKTMAARELATASGLDYAILSGGDVAPLGSDAVTKLHDVFNWAKGSSKGVLIFIDEAEAFLSSRGGQPMSEGKRAALNTLLSKTGTASTDFCLVLATNRPGDLDEAIIDRLDEALEFPVPEEKEREDILVQQLKQQTSPQPSTFWRWITGRGSGVAIPVDDNVQDALKMAAKKLRGFSGRQLEKLVGGVCATALSEGKPQVTAALVKSIVDLKLKEHKEREEFFAA